MARLSLLCVLLFGVPAFTHARVLRATNVKSNVVSENVGNGKVDSQHVQSTGQAMKSWSALVSGLWADLVIEHFGKVPGPFTKSDKEVKDQFVADCQVTMKVSENSKDAVGGVVEDMCAKAGGKAPKCKSMRTTWWEAVEKNQLKPWCEKTFVWFAEQTSPRCMSKCRALFCKERCEVGDEIKDIEDKIAAFQIKIDTLEAKEERLEKVMLAEKMEAMKIEQHLKEVVQPAGQQIDVLKKTQKSMLGKLDGLRKDSKKAQSDQEKAYDVLTKLKASKNAKKADIEKARKNNDDAWDKYNEARTEELGLNERAVMIQGQIAKSITIEKFEKERHEEMEKAYEEAKKVSEKEKAALAADKAKLEKAKAEEVAAADKLKKAIVTEYDKFTTTTTTTTTTTLPTIVNASGNNGAAYCSAYCAYNWNSQAPSFWKGGCCLKAYNANNMEEVSCTSKGSGAGLLCTCQQQDSTPFVTNPPIGSGPSFSLMDNVCSDATGVATLTPTTTTTTTTNLDCNCFHCGNSDPFNNADVCGPASGACGPSSPNNGGCWTNRNSGCVCGTHKLIQPCQCFHCGGSSPFPNADVCGGASGACGPTSPNNGGCWNNVAGATCQCGSQQTTGR